MEAFSLEHSCRGSDTINLDFLIMRELGPLLHLCASDSLCWVHDWQLLLHCTDTVLHCTVLYCGDYADYAIGNIYVGVDFLLGLWLV